MGFFFFFFFSFDAREGQEGLLQPGIQSEDELGFGRGTRNERMMLKTGALRKGGARHSHTQGHDAHPSLLSQPSRNMKPDLWIAKRSSIGKLEKGVRAESTSHNANINLPVPVLTLTVGHQWPVPPVEKHNKWLIYHPWGTKMGLLNSYWKGFWAFSHIEVLYFLALLYFLKICHVKFLWQDFKKNLYRGGH